MTKTVQIETTAAEPVSGIEIFVPLNKLKKSPKNARKVPHGEAAIEALAASIEHKGLIQNLVIEPEMKDEKPTGAYFVTAGEGRRLAYLLRAKRRQIRKNHPVRCRLDTENDPSEISLDENVTRTPMHPADQFERFRELADGNGWGAEEIGARFGVSGGVVKQRLRLGAVSPKLLQVYREDGLTLDQLMAFAITEDHARQEQVFENLHHNREPWIIRRDMTANNVPADDRRAVFVGADAYIEAGGNIIRDLFSEDRGGFFEDAGLLDMLAVEKLREIADGVQAEGWKWVEAHIDYPHAHGMRRFYPQAVDLSDEDEARLEALSTEHDELAEGYSSYDEMPEDVAKKLEAVSDEIDAISAKRYAYDANVIAHGGAFVVLHHDGTVRIERGFVRPEDEALADPQPEDEAEAIEPEAVEDEQAEDSDEEVQDFEDEDEEPGKPISDSLIRDLSAHRTLALRVALGEQPGMALVALTHTLTAQLFYSYAEAGCLEIRPTVTPLGGHAAGIEDTPLAARASEAHDAWAERMPRDVADLWGFIVALDDASASPEILAYDLAPAIERSLAVETAELDRARRRFARGEAVIDAGLTLGGGIAMGAVLAISNAPLPMTVLAVLASAGAIEALSGYIRGVSRGALVTAALARLEDMAGPHSAPIPAKSASGPIGRSIALDRGGVHVRLESGERLGIAGQSGSGKTSLLETLAGIRPPDRNSGICLDGQPIEALPPETVRAAFALSPQDAQLLSGTVRDNLRVARSGLSDEQLWAALEVACLAVDVRTMPHGLDQWVGDGGARLSGGQRKRLSIARAVLAAKPWLLLDEPSEGLDMVTEARLARRLDTWLRDTGTGLVVVSHRGALLALAGKDDGSILEIGGSSQSSP